MISINWLITALKHLIELEFRCHALGRRQEANLVIPKHTLEIRIGIGLNVCNDLSRVISHGVNQRETSIEIAPAIEMCGRDELVSEGDKMITIVEEKRGLYWKGFWALK